MTFSASSVTVTSIGPLKPGDHYTVKILVNGCGDGNTWKADVWSGSNASGGVYVDSGTGNETTNVPCGVLACNDPLGELAVSTILGSGSIRGPLTRMAPAAIPSTTSSRISSRNPPGTCTSGGTHSRTPPSATSSSAATPPQVRWETDTDGNPIYVDSPICYGGNNARTPAPLGTLISDGGARYSR